MADDIRPCTALYLQLLMDSFSCFPEGGRGWNSHRLVYQIVRFARAFFLLLRLIETMGTESITWARGDNSQSRTQPKVWIEHTSSYHIVDRLGMRPVERSLWYWYHDQSGSVFFWSGRDMNRTGVVREPIYMRYCTVFSRTAKPQAYGHSFNKPPQLYDKW